MPSLSVEWKMAGMKEIFPFWCLPDALTTHNSQPGYQVEEGWDRKGTVSQGKCKCAINGSKGKEEYHCTNIFR